MRTRALAAVIFILGAVGCDGTVAGSGEQDTSATGELNGARKQKTLGDACDVQGHECAVGLLCEATVFPAGNCLPDRSAGTIGQACRPGEYACDPGLACDRDTNLCLGLAGAHFCFNSGLAYGGYSSACAGSLKCVRDVCTEGQGRPEPWAPADGPPPLPPCPLTDACGLANGTLNDTASGCACGPVFMNPWTEDCVDPDTGAREFHSFPANTNRCSP